MISLIQDTLVNQPLDWKKRRKQPLGHPLLSRTVEYWPLDDARNSNANVTQRGIHAGLSLSMGANNPQDAQGVYGGQASSFASGSTNFLKRTSEAALQCGDIDFVCSSWFYQGGMSANRGIMTKDTAAAGGREWTMYVTSGNNPNIIVFDGTNIVGRVIHSVTISTATWYFVVAYHSATSNEVGMSINGGAFETTATTGAPATTATEFRIGNDARTTGNALWDGRLQRCWIAKNYIPSASDCAWLYNGGIGRKYPFI